MQDHNVPMMPAPITNIFQPMMTRGIMSKVWIIHETGSVKTAVHHVKYIEVVKVEICIMGIGKTYPVRIEGNRLICTLV